VHLLTTRLADFKQRDRQSLPPRIEAAKRPRLGERNTRKRAAMLRTPRDERRLALQRDGIGDQPPARPGSRRRATTGAWSAPGPS
jgi:hypothetical protein